LREGLFTYDRSSYWGRHPSDIRGRPKGDGQAVPVRRAWHASRPSPERQHLDACGAFTKDTLNGHFWVFRVSIFEVCSRWSSYVLGHHESSSRAPCQ